MAGEEIGAAVDNSSETSGDLNKEAWDKYNLLRAAVLVDHTTGGLHTALSSSLISDTDDTDDLGSATKEWRNLYIDGTANIDSLVADTADINAGTVDAITSLTAAGNLDIGAHNFRAATLTADGLTSSRVIFAGANGLLSDSANLSWNSPTLTISCPSETAAGNAIWIDLRSTVTSGDLTGIRSRVYGNAASAGANIRGGYLEAKMAASSKYAAMLEGALFHADYSAGSATISGDVRGFTAHISQGSGLNAANLYGGLINIQTRGNETITSDDVGLMIRNEAVGGNGRTMDAGIKITDLNMGGATNSFTYGIDLNGVGIATADFRASDGTTVSASKWKILNGLIPVATKTDNYTVLTTDFGTTLRMNSASEKTFTLPSVSSANDGARITFVKISSGKLIIDAADSDIIVDSDAGTTIYNDVSTEIFATITLEYVDATVTWVAIGAMGTWTTTT